MRQEGRGEVQAFKSVEPVQMSGNQFMKNKHQIHSRIKFDYEAEKKLKVAEKDLAESLKRQRELEAAEDERRRERKLDELRAKYSAQP